MKTVIKSETQLKTFRISRISFPKDKFNYSITELDSKFYQKVFVVLMSLSTILINPESPKKLESICENHNSNLVCNVW